ncbi:MAG: ribulose-phosphate 3-epimerase, partial [Lachnospiraceae bacterium]|nr:ribulose-phosphate 3-epimerase [Lachnospiraceae bacterium]
ERLKTYGIKYIHLDVMDGLFVPNISFGIPIIESIDKIKGDLIFDTHIMIMDPIRYVEKFSDVGSDIITFHYEATKDVDATIDAIKKCGKKVGLSIKPDTEVEKIYKYLFNIDMLLVMSVYPGFGGQKYIEESTDRIKILKKEIVDKGYKVDIEVDGGIKDDNVKKVCDAGADIIVSGSYIFKGDMKNNIDKMYEAIR